MKFGSSDISKAYIGSTEIQKAYLGSDLIWETEDTEAPSIPDGLVATNLCQTTFTLSWDASTDNVGVTGYKIFKNGGLYQDVGDVLTWGITGQSAGASANWTVSAYDAATNESNPSSPLNVTQTTSITLFNVTKIGQASSGLACGEAATWARYKTGSAVSINNGDVFYIETCAVNLQAGGGLWYSDGTVAFNVSNSGIVSNKENCM